MGVLGRPPAVHNRSVISARDGTTADLEALYRDERRRLWALAYRMTGTGEDAEDVVQEAFARLLTQRPAPISPAGWLVRTVTHLSIDALRRRRRRSYAGPWLPSPIEMGEDLLDALPCGTPDPEARYGTRESVTFAFLVALEALGPRQRAVLLLRDVMGHGAHDAAEVLGISEANARVLHHRARRAMDAYDRRRCVPTPELRERHHAALEAFVAALEAQDGARVEALLAESARTSTDAGGAYTALATPLVGRARVARLYLTATMHRAAGGTRREIRLVNGLPAVLITVLAPVRRQAPRTLLRCELDAEGRIELVQAVLAPRKLAALRFA
jgi:RNA polymerase sigma-70 factor (ECF subfamily)